MKPIMFPQSNVVYAKDQKQYLPLPAYRVEKFSMNGEVISCWRISVLERIKILFSGKIWLKQWTFHKPLQPQRVQVENPFIKEK